MAGQSNSKMMGDNFVLDLWGLLVLVNYLCLLFFFSQKKGEKWKQQDNKKKSKIADMK